MGKRDLEINLLILDGVINAILGLALLVFPGGLIRVLDLPATDQVFYPSILGAVLLGIGLALFLEALTPENQRSGLGTGGAVLINTVGSGVLILWLLFGGLSISWKGSLVLWTVALVVLLTGGVEWMVRFRKNS